MHGLDHQVVVVGNVGIDTNVYIPGAEIDSSVESNFTLNIDHVGQAGGYTSRGYAQLAKRTAFIGYVGDDFQGEFIRHEFTIDGIDTSALFIDPSGTSRSINFVFQDGTRKNFYDGKGHMTLQPDREACTRVLSNAKLAHFHLPNWARHLLPIARESGLTIACDIQDIVDPRDAYRQEFIEYADILFFSAVNQSDIHALLEFFLAAKPQRIVVAGMGAQGSAIGTSSGIQFYPPVSMAAPVVDTNGAGDGLAVGFLVSYVLEAYPLEQSILRGHIAARHTCSQKASSSTLITPSELESHHQALAASGWPAPFNFIRPE